MKNGFYFTCKFKLVGILLILCLFFSISSSSQVFKVGAARIITPDLTNDAYGYILTNEDFNNFDRYDYVSITSLGEKTGEILITELLDMIDKNRQPQKK